MWTVYGTRGYARHDIYLTPFQKSNAAKLGVISRACCVVAIATGKISVAFLIQRIQGSSKWRTWFLRFCSISVGLTASVVVVFLFAQCQPVRTLWTPSMLKDGTGHCWDPIPINNFNIAIASESFPDYISFGPARLTCSHSRLLRMARLRSCHIASGNCLETPDGTAEEARAVCSAGVGCPVCGQNPQCSVTKLMFVGLVFVPRLKLRIYDQRRTRRI